MKRIKTFYEFVKRKYPHESNLMRFIERNPKIFNMVFKDELIEFKKYNERFDRLETIPAFYKFKNSF